MSIRNDGIDFAHLDSGDSRLLRHFVNDLKTQGFVRVRMSDGPLLDGLKAGLSAGRQMETFRFPPVDGQATYTPDLRRCFTSLFKLSRLCLTWLLAHTSCEQPEFKTLRERLRAAEQRDADLFSPSGKGHTPFRDGTAPFSSSFFNVFDYDHGLLNVHKDRYLITAIFADSDPKTASTRSALWVRAAHGGWTNVDQELGANDVVFMIGEELEHLLSGHENSLYAAEHCIRVDPNGEFLARAHFRADPASTRTGNRLSTAFILGEPNLVMD